MKTALEIISERKTIGGEIFGKLLYDAYLLWKRANRKLPACRRPINSANIGISFNPSRDTEMTLVIDEYHFTSWDPDDRNIDRAHLENSRGWVLDMNPQPYLDALDHAIFYHCAQHFREEQEEIAANKRGQP